MLLDLINNSSATYYLELGIFIVYINDSFICNVKENKFCSPTKKKAIEMKLM